ncbi:hypothetical protein NIES2107_24800 [Nostoc carneum NIES-2107]|nr:hypothetical protein NIES2107_24800 [Nostoc carneum NIES-2107]
MFISLLRDWKSLKPRALTQDVGWVEERNPTPAWVTLSLTHPTNNYASLLKALEVSKTSRRNSGKTLDTLLST